MVRDPTAADDVFQDVALVLWRKFDEFDPSRSFGAWARGVAVRQAMQYFDRHRRTPIPFSPETIEALLKAYEEEEESAETGDGAARQAALRHCIMALPEKSRRLLELRYDARLKLHEVAERLSTTLDAAHKALSRLRLALRKCIEKELAAAS